MSDLPSLSQSGKTPIADMMRTLAAAGCSFDQIVLAVEGHELACQVDSQVDKTAQRRREWDKNYKRIKRSQVDIPPESGGQLSYIKKKEDIK